MLISAVVLLPALYSCTEDTPVEEKKLDSSLKELNFSKDGGSQQIFIVSEGVDSWDAYSTESWIDVAVDRDGGILTVTVAPSKEILTVFPGRCSCIRDGTDDGNISNPGRTRQHIRTVHPWTSWDCAVRSSQWTFILLQRHFG